jgi:hypothetical protein
LLNPNAMNMNVRAISLKAHQIATFFASDGTEVSTRTNVPPTLSVPIFEVPIVPPLPEAMDYFPSRIIRGVRPARRAQSRDPTN